ncbi:MAG: hypothetical protein KKD18_04200 [Nanoarchaeota archaeon]|nr:hypothetical protein [Nanoarchaeota archaeon]MBU0977593.1 hypothetical protein [Nanoarchaeota archaeon]
MERGISDRSVLDEFAEDFCRIAEKHVKYIVVSGYVAISHGRFRATEDIDMIIERVDFEKFNNFHQELDKAGFHCMQSTKVKDIYEYLEKGDGVRYVREGTLLPPEMEVKFAKDELDELQLKTRKKIPFTGLDIWFSSIEMNIAFKEELLKSPKDLEDARHLRKIYEGDINENFIEEIKRKIKKERLK